MKLDSAVFYTNDLARAVAFYKDTLGWSLEYVQESRFASFAFENAKLGIKQAREEREVPGHQTVFLACEDIEKEYENIRLRNIPIFKDLTKEDWAINFSILDPDGNKIQFVKRTA